MSSPTVRALIAFGILGVMFVALVKLVMGAKQEHVVPEVTREQADEPTLDDDQTPAASTSSQNSQAQLPSNGLANRTSKDESEKKKHIAELQRAVAPRLKRYSEMNSKVFLNSGEKIEKSALLKDVNLFKNLISILTEPSADSRVQEEQDSAIDLLLESSVKDHNPDAQATLLAVIGNESLGNSQQPFDQKELGGIKAEIMYKWSAGDPSVKSSIEANLPDSATQKLWQNVLEIQSENQSESESLGRPGH